MFKCTALNVDIALGVSLAVNTIYNVLLVCLQKMFGPLEGWLDDLLNVSTAFSSQSVDASCFETVVEAVPAGIKGLVP